MRILLASYELTMALLALLAVGFASAELMEPGSLVAHGFFVWAERLILFIFALDYILRWSRAPDRGAFMRNNIPDLIAILPLGSVSRGFRLVRGLAFGFVFFRRAGSFWRTNGLIYVLYLTVVTVVLGAIGVYAVEYGHTITCFADALWWSFVTITTVGYGDITPITPVGRLIAAFVMMVGICFLGMLTGTITTYFLRGRRPRDLPGQGEVDLSCLSAEEVKQVANFAEFLRQKKP
ncbi:MAG TPA: potassium channel family protein [Firmicutes bacterium]|jgi:voltage-gated potassium channel|nr:potassium channel family protein [Bacillota bacterium]